MTWLRECVCVYDRDTVRAGLLLMTIYERHILMVAEC